MTVSIAVWPRNRSQSCRYSFVPRCPRLSRNLGFGRPRIGRIRPLRTIEPVAVADAEFRDIQIVREPLGDGLGREPARGAADERIAGRHSHTDADPRTDRAGDEALARR